METLNLPLEQNIGKRATLWELRLELTEDQIRTLVAESSKRELTDEEQEVLLSRLRWADDAHTALVITKPIAISDDCKGTARQMESVETAIANPNKNLIDALASSTLEAEDRAAKAEKDAAESGMVIGVIWRVLLVAMVLYATRFLSEQSEAFCAMVAGFGGIIWIVRYIQHAENRKRQRTM